MVASRHSKCRLLKGVRVRVPPSALIMEEKDKARWLLNSFYSSIWTEHDLKHALWKIAKYNPSSDKKPSVANESILPTAIA